MREIIMFTLPGCARCDLIQRYFERQKIKFHVFDYTHLEKNRKVNVIYPAIFEVVRKPDNTVETFHIDGTELIKAIKSR